MSRRSQNDVSNPALAELWQAEGIANGGLSIMLHVDSFTPYNASRGFSQANMRQAKFVTSASNRWLFVDRRSVAETAVVVSLPSLLWRDFSSLTLDCTPGSCAQAYNECAPKAGAHEHQLSVCRATQCCYSGAQEPYELLLGGG